MYDISANFTVSSYPAGAEDWQHEETEWTFPYWDTETMEEQKEKALAKYEELKKKLSPQRTVTLCRLSVDDICEGEYAPTLLRTSKDDSYEYDGFEENFGRFSRY